MKLVKPLVAQPYRALVLTRRVKVILSSEHLENYCADCHRLKVTNAASYYANFQGFNLFFFLSIHMGTLVEFLSIPIHIYIYSIDLYVCVCVCDMNL